MWHFVHGWPVFFAMSEFAFACCDATMITNTAINVAIPAARVEIELIVFAFRINNLPRAVQLARLCASCLGEAELSIRLRG